MTGTKIGYLFPGQGSQYVGMGKDFYDSFQVARTIFEKANQILGYSMTDLCFEGPEEKLTRTCYAQPAIFVVSMAALEVFKEKYSAIQAIFAAGLSLGEFSALVSLGAISFDEGLLLVKKRAEAMEDAAVKNPGTMASVIGLDESSCIAIAHETGCEVANLNSPEQIALSGTMDSIESACRLAEEKGAKRAIRLQVGGAFHSSLMREAQKALGEALDQTSIKTPRGTFIPNVSALEVVDPEEIRSLLSKQLTHPVRWLETMRRARQSKVDVFIEIGPGKVLRGLARKCESDLKVQNCGTVQELEKLGPLFDRQ